MTQGETVDETTHDTPPLTLGRATWTIREDALPRLIEAHRAGGRSLQQFAMRAGAAAPKAARRNAADRRAGGAVAIIPLTGVITPRGSLLSMLFGGGSSGLQGFRADFREALSDPDVGAIVLDVDSPGGLIDLVPETAAEIRDVRGTKPIIAVANTMAASAAYWIASQADELVVTPSGDVGSIGVYMVHEDYSGWNEKQGIQPTYIKAGKYKTEGNMDEPLDDEAQQAWQEEVDDLYAMFVAAVADGRGISTQEVIDGYGEGRTLLADRALAAGMVDRIATLETVVSELLVPGAGDQTGASARLVTAPRHAAESPPDDDPAPDEPPTDDPPADEPPPVTDPPADQPTGSEPNTDLDAGERADIAEILTA